jgi:hypothetical protein
MKTARAFLTVLFVAAPLAIAQPAPDTFHDLVAFDANHDGRVNDPELTAYFLAHGATAADAAKHVVDVLTGAAGCDLGCADVSLAVAVRLIDNITLKEKKPSDKPVGWQGLKLKRSVTDAPDPRQAKSDFPAIFAYKHDKETTDRDQFTFLGAVEFYRYTRSFGDPTTLPNSFAVTPGINLDVDGSKKKNENTIDFALPLAWSWVRKDTSFFESLSLAVAPKFTTDRGFNRRVYDVTTTFGFASQPFARAGFRTRFPSGPSVAPRVVVYWAPAMLLETGRVADAAGNAKLEALKGSYVRAVASIQATLQPVFIDPRLSLGIRYFHRYTLEHSENSDYGEATAMFDLTPTGTVALTATYRRGRKPPAFEMNDTFLFGIGVKQ